MKRKAFYFITFFLLAGLSKPYAQPYKHKLIVGEMVPDVSLSILKNGKFQTVRLSDFRGKLVILDYWNIWCGSCIAAFPNLEKIQQKYSKEILILPVSFINSKAQVSDFLKKRKGTEKEVHLPFAVFENKDNTLFQSIPTIGYPYEVWIDKNGKFIRASDATDITIENIGAYLSGSNLTLKSKNYQMDFDRTKPLLIKNNGGPDTAYSYRSVITGFIDSLGYYFDNSTSDGKIHLFYGNKPLIDLIKYSLKDGLSTDFYNQLVVFEGPSLKKKLYPGHKAMADRIWISANRYCYDLSLPVGYSKKEIYEFMHQDIDRFFRIKTIMESRFMDCLVLKRTDSVDRLASKSNESSMKTKGRTVEIKRQPINSLLSAINGEDAPVLFDGTGYKNNLDMSLNLPEKFNTDLLNKQLLNYGLKLEIERRNLPVIVIRE